MLFPFSHVDMTSYDRGRVSLLPCLGVANCSTACVNMQGR